MWHVPSGPLPLLAAKYGGRDTVVKDPWAGWKERRAGADSSNPYFGAGHVGIIWLNVRLRSRKDPSVIGLSSFEWIGNWYRPIGQPAPAVTERFWQTLRRWVKKRAIRIPRSGPLDGLDPEIWALPNALAAIEAGAARDTNPI
jgi:hypothetical protein